MKGIGATRVRVEPLASERGDEAWEQATKRTKREGGAQEREVGEEEREDAMERRLAILAVTSREAGEPSTSPRANDRLNAGPIFGTRPNAGPALVDGRSCANAPSRRA